jgi:hypothetical protein
MRMVTLPSSSCGSSMQNAAGEAERHHAATAVLVSCNMRWLKCTVSRHDVHENCLLSWIGAAMRLMSGMLGPDSAVQLGCEAHLLR